MKRIKLTPKYTPEVISIKAILGNLKAFASNIANFEIDMVVDTVKV